MKLLVESDEPVEYLITFIFTDDTFIGQKTKIQNKYSGWIDVAGYAQPRDKYVAYQVLVGRSYKDIREVILRLKGIDYRFSPDLLEIRSDDVAILRLGKGEFWADRLREAALGRVGRVDGG